MKQKIKNLDNFEATKRAFDIKRTNEITLLEANIKQNALSLKKLEEEVKITTLSLAALKEPEMLTLPTEMSISQELKDAHLEFLNLREEQIGNVAINANNKKIKQKKN